MRLPTQADAKQQMRPQYRSRQNQISLFHPRQEALQAWLQLAILVGQVLAHQLVNDAGA
jgi:hypothetical protein